MNAKERCPICNRKLRLRCFIFNKLKEIEICKTCDKRIGNNKFYTPLTHKRENKRISNFNITDQEKKLLADKKGWQRVNQDLGILNAIRDRVTMKKRLEKINEQLNNQNKKQMNKKFIEGLK